MTPSTQSSDRPRLALTMGDVAGIGPEVLVRALEDPLVWEWSRPLVIGHPEILQRAVTLLGASLSVLPISDLRDIENLPPGVPCWNPAGDDAADVAPGGLDRRAGEAAYRYLVAAARAALEGYVQGITTAPLSKAALHLAGLNYPGHTEILAEVCGVKEFGMMLYLAAERCRAIDARTRRGSCDPTHFVAKRSRIDHNSRSQRKIGLIDAFMREMGCAGPQIAVCALNPHAGEEGLFGDEESRLIAPAVDGMRQRGLDVTGPLPADTLIKRAVGGEFDAVVAMYHDQGHIPLKLIGFDTAVNVTLGLPLIRTSPSHGTAFDIAWKGRARADGMIQAIHVAAVRARNARK